MDLELEAVQVLIYLIDLSRTCKLNGSFAASTNFKSLFREGNNIRNKKQMSCLLKISITNVMSWKYIKSASSNNPYLTCSLWKDTLRERKIYFNEGRIKITSDIKAFDILWYFRVNFLRIWEQRTSMRWLLGSFQDHFYG